MGTHQEIERLLLAEVNQARMAHEIAEKAFSEAFTKDGLARIELAAHADVSATNAWIEALREFSAFILHRTVPDRFKEREIQPKPLPP